MTITPTISAKTKDREVKHHATLIFDIETNGLFPEVNTIHCICAIDPDTGEEMRWNSQTPGEIDIGVRTLIYAGTLKGQNIIGYDIPVVKSIYPQWSWDGIEIFDTKVASGLLYPHLKQLDWGMGDRCKVPPKLRGSHKLKAWGYRLGILKGDFGETTDWSEWSPDLEDYCMQDVRVTAKFVEHLEAQITDANRDALDMEQKLQEIITHQELHGFLFDIPKAQQLYARLHKRKQELLGELQEQFPPKVIYGGVYKKDLDRANELLDSRPGKVVWCEADECIVDAHVQDDRKWLREQGIKFNKDKVIPFNPNSEQQITERFKALGWKPTEFTDKGNPKMDEPVILKLVEDYPEAAGLGEFVMVDKRLSQIGDGKNSWLKKVWDDGRMHGQHNPNGTITYRFTHFSPNMSQVPKVGTPYGKECRELFHVPEDHNLVGCDASGLELRMLAHYLAKWDGGAYAREVVEGDIHTANTEAAGLSDREDGKTFIYAFLYGAGDGKLGSIVGGGTKQGKKLRARFLAKTPALNKLVNAVRLRAFWTKKLRGLDGRVLHIRSAHSALNSLLQCAGSIVVKRATVIFRHLLEQEYGLDMGYLWSLVAHSHDEFQTECLGIDDKHVAVAGPRSIELAGEYYNLRCPLAGEAKIGNNWAETH